MNTIKLNILFLIEKNKCNSQGKCPLKCRLTYLGKRKPFSTGMYIKPENWNNKQQLAKPPNEENNYINSQISLIKNSINQAFLFLQLQNSDFSVENIYKQYAGETQNEEKTLLDAFNYHNNRMEKLIGIEATFTSWEKYHQTKNHISAFIWHKYKKKDIQLKELNQNFINEYEFFLKTEKKFMPNTVFKSVQRFRKIIRMAVAMDYLPKDPFMLYKAKKPKKEIIYLTQEELENLEKNSFASERLKQVRDMFIFCCYTGLAYKEMANLSSENLVTKKGNLWIEMNRQKTQKKFSIPLLSKAVKILNEYRNGEEILPKISNQKFNAYLKEIAEVTNIKKNLTHHIARKTFATTILLNNDIPIEIVSELLGHSKITMTQEHYAEVMPNKLNSYIEKLGKKLK